MRLVLIVAGTLLFLAPLAAQEPSPAPSPAPAGFTYRAEGRRDPFVSLLRRGADPRSGPGGARPNGLPGLAVAEVTLKGTVASRTGFVAILQGADNKTYIVRPGDRLLDGVVRSIASDAIVLLQQVNDPLTLDKQREVRKVLRQTEEAK
jgi:Tfp pilus assembly protein PilP